MRLLINPITLACFAISAAQSRASTVGTNIVIVPEKAKKEESIIKVVDFKRFDCPDIRWYEKRPRFQRRKY
jgi:hypothetical protein